MSKTQMLQQHGRRILAYSSKRSCLFHSYRTLPAAAIDQTLPALDQGTVYVTPVLEQWRKQGQQVKPSDLRGQKEITFSPERLHDLLRCGQASEWMGEQKAMTLLPEDYVSRLHLIQNVLGLEEAEKFFKSIPENMRDYNVYAILLSSYTRTTKTLEKAEATFKKMRELGFHSKPFPYNSMVCLYARLRKLDTVEKLLREMKENNVEVESLTANNVLRVYATFRKIKAMTLFKRWIDEAGIKLERGTMVVMAGAYTRSGSIEKAMEMYGDVAGSETQVYNLWNRYKKGKKVEDDGYRAVISSLLKLNDVEGAEKIYGEWKPYGPEMDMSIPGLLISRYCAERKDLKVEELVKSIRTKKNEMRLRMLKDGLICCGVIGGVVAILSTCVWVIIQDPRSFVIACLLF